MKWTEIQLKTKKTEKIFFGCIVGCLVGGIIAEVMVQGGRFLFYIPDYSSICLTILSIQATVATLVFTVLSLMTNKMDKMYMGVSFNDFLLNLKPWLFKQEWIIITELSLIALSIICQMAEWYNIVFTVFIISMLLVFFSVHEIYEAFSGTEKVEEEIKAYVTCNNKKVFASGILRNFTDQWKKIIPLQSNGEYQDYIEAFNYLFSGAFPDIVSRKRLLSQCVVLEKSLFDSKNDENSLRGFNFAQNCYDQVWKYINKYESESSKTNIDFNLFSEIYSDFIISFTKVDIRKIEKNFRGSYFIETIIQDALYMNACTIDTDVLSIPDIGATINFSYYLGDLISDALEPDKSIKINEEVWCRPLRHFTSHFSYPETLKKMANQAAAECCFNFMLAQIKNGNYKLIHNSWYKEIAGLENVQECYYFAFAAIKLHCYIYYLAYYEKTAKDIIIDSAKEFIESDSVINEFSQFLMGIAERDDNVFAINKGTDKNLNIFNNQLCSKIEKDLRWQELMPVEGMKTLVLPDAIVDFTAFLACFIANRFQNYDVLKAIIPENKASYYYQRYISMDQEEQLKQFFRLMGVKDYSYDLEDGTKINNLDICAQTAYTEFTNIIQEKYKDSVIKEAENAKKITKSEYDQQIETAQDELLKYLKEHLSGLISDDIREDTKGNIFKRSGYEHLNIFTFRVFSDTNIEELIKEHYNQLFVVICEILAQRLINGNCVKRLFREKLSENDLLQYTDNDNKVIIGSEYSLYPDNYHYKEKIENWIKENEHYVTGFKGTTLIVEKGKLKLNFRNAKIVVKNENINDLIERKGTHLDEETGYYNYSPSVNMPVEFTKEELSNYLTNKRRVVFVSLDMGVEVNNDKDQIIGEAIKM